MATILCHRAACLREDFLKEQEECQQVHEVDYGLISAQGQSEQEVPSQLEAS